MFMVHLYQCRYYFKIPTYRLCKNERKKLFQTLSMHGSPKNVQVYPTQSYPTQAFQSTSGQSVPSVHASPVPSARASQSQYSQSHQTHVVSIQLQGHLFHL